MSDQDIMQLFSTKKLVMIQAPMVRYSKLAFRLLCREYGTDICYTPMIIADSFVKSSKARDSEFSYHPKDFPLVVQFGASDAIIFAQAAQLVMPYCQAVNINCGCPQKWAIEEGIGAALIDKPELIRDMIQQKNNLCSPNFPMSVKIRIHDNLNQTVDLVRQIEKAGAHYLTIHGRTKKTPSSSPVNAEAVKLLRKHVSLPVIFNGDVFTLSDAQKFQEQTGVHGVMSARGLLRNPALFAGYDTVPSHCVKRFIELATETGDLHFSLLHNHLMFMLHPPVMKHADLLEFSSLTSVCAIVEFLKDRNLF